MKTRPAQVTALKRVAATAGVAGFLVVSSNVVSQATQTEERGVARVDSGDLGQPAFEPYRKRWALVVGIDKYAGVPDLRYAVADARAVSELLLDSLGFDEVTLLTDEKAKRIDILKAIVELKRKTGSEDQVLFFFAGHGVTFGEGSAEIGYLIPQDVTGLSESSVAGEGISMSDLRERLVKLPAKHVLLAVDACYGGYGAVAYRSLPVETRNYLRAVTTSSARQIMTAGKRDEKVLESDAWSHSAFTYKFLDGLESGVADGNGDGLVTAAELHSYLQPAVVALTGGRQTPQFAKLRADEGEFVFVLPRATLESHPARRTAEEIPAVSSVGPSLAVTPDGAVAEGTILEVEGKADSACVGAQWLAFEHDTLVWPRRRVTTPEFTANLAVPLDFNGGRLALICIPIESSEDFDSWLKRGRLEPRLKPDDFTVLRASPVVVGRWEENDLKRPATLADTELSVLLLDDFEAGTNFWHDDGVAEWTREEEEGDHHYCVTATTAQWSLAEARISRPSQRIGVRLRVRVGRHDPQLGSGNVQLVGRDGTAYVLNFFGDAGRFDVERDGQVILAGREGPLRFDQDRWHTLEVRADGTNLSAAVDGRAWLSQAVNVAITTDRVRVGAGAEKAGSVWEVCFDSILVEGE